MTDTAQGRASRTNRQRLRQRGLARFQVLGLDTDRKLIRSLARLLAEHSPDSRRLRATVSPMLSEEPPKKGGVFAALRRSPLVGSGVKFKREGRTVS